MKNILTMLYMTPIYIVTMPFGGTLLMLLFAADKGDLTSWVLSVIPMLGVGVAIFHMVS